MMEQRIKSCLPILGRQTDLCISIDSPKISNKSSVTYHCMYLDCGKTFGKLSRLTLHERTHTGDRPFVCNNEDCAKTYARKEHLTRHYLAAHNSAQTSQLVRCEDCKKDFSDKYAYKKHCDRMHNPSRYSCPTCDKTFRKQQHLRTHSYTHTGIKPYCCTVAGCDSRFDVPSKLKRHLLCHQEQHYSCPYSDCEFKFNKFREISKHVKEMHPHKRVCSQCNQTFPSKKDLHSHLLEHEEGREAFFCPIQQCGRYYFHEKNLHTHIRSKHERHREFVCVECGKELSSKQKLQQHMKIHSDEYQAAAGRKTPLVGEHRKTRKDKGSKKPTKKDIPKWLSGYNGEYGIGDSDLMVKESDDEKKIMVNVSNGISCDNCIFNLDGISLQNTHKCKEKSRHIVSNRSTNTPSTKLTSNSCHKTKAEKVQRTSVFQPQQIETSINSEKAMPNSPTSGVKSSFTFPARMSPICQKSAELVKKLINTDTCKLFNKYN